MTLKSLLQRVDGGAVIRCLVELYPSAAAEALTYRVFVERLAGGPVVPGALVLRLEPLEDAEGGVEVFGVDESSSDRTPCGLDLLPHRKWLGIRLTEETLQRYSAEEIVAHCLREMTFHGAAEESIDEQRRQIAQAFADTEACSSEHGVSEPRPSRRPNPCNGSSAQQDFSGYR
ncbi:MAG: DUF6557 family protein [Phycisphaerae bacterium]